MQKPRLRFVWPFVFVAALVLAIAQAPPRSGAPRRLVAFQTETMGTWASLKIVTADSAAVADLAYEALVTLHRVDSLMSNWTDVSEVARINREAAPSEIAVEPEVARVIALAQTVTEESGGAFDITVEPLVKLWGFIGGPARVPSQQQIDGVLERVGPDKLRFDAATGRLHFVRDGVRIDLGGIAKGYGVDQVAAVLKKAGTSDALIDLSGNMVALGHAADHEGWWVGIRDPAGEQTHLARLLLEDEAVATSGDYEQFVAADGERYGHILDPRTGWSARGLSSVTVVAEEAMLADAWATALFVLGPETARELSHKRDDLSVILIEPQKDAKHIIWVEEQLVPRFELRVQSKATHTVRTF